MTGNPAGPPPVVALFDLVADVYETVGPPFFDHFGPLLVEHAGVRPGDRVVDLAAGSGAVALPALAATGPGGSLLAVDLAPAMVARLQQRLAGTGARVELGDAADPGLGPASADVLLCGFALFFLPDPPAALRRWRDAVRPGGRVAVSTWGRPDEAFSTVRAQVERLGAQVSRRGQVYDDPAALAGALRDAGLVDVQVLTVAQDLVLADVPELLAWCRTHGARGWLDQLGPQAHAQLRADLQERWPAAVPMTWQAHLAVGTRPGA